MESLLNEAMPAPSSGHPVQDGTGLASRTAASGLTDSSSPMWIVVMSWQRLLVPVESAFESDRVFDVAMELATQHQAAITLMYVIESIGEDQGDEFESFYEELAEDIRARLHVLISRFRRAGLEAKPEIVVGHKVRSIVEYTVTEPVDLVIIPSERADLEHPESSLQNRNHQVALLCQCPVMLIR